MYFTHTLAPQLDMDEEDEIIAELQQVGRLCSMDERHFLTHLIMFAGWRLFLTSFTPLLWIWPRDFCLVE